MKVIGRRTLRAFWDQHPDAEEPLKNWYQLAKSATWASPHQVKAVLGSADFIGDGRAVFNIGGNKYRLVVRFWFQGKRAYIRHVLTHAEYAR